jgi:beta-glucosidase
MIYLLGLLSSAAVASASPASATSSLLSSSDFLWGSATASYQVEGAYEEDGRGRTVWDDYSHTPGKVANGDTGDVATDHYHRFKEDIQLIQDMGINSYRLSLAWSRIIPDGEGAVNQAGIDHYNEVFDALEEANIVPFVTLFHWDTPSVLEENYGGWLSDKMETCE